MAKKIITKKMLEPFTSKDGSRPALERIFRQNDYVIASDGHVLVRIPEGTVENYADIPIQEMPHVSAIVPTETPLDVTLTKALIEKKLKLAPQVKGKVTCEECNGSGNVEWYHDGKDGVQYTKSFKCPVCMGKGWTEETENLVPDPEQLFSFSGGFMNPECLNDIIKVMNTFGVAKMKIRATDNYKVMFAIGDIQILRAFVVLSNEDKTKLNNAIKIK